MTNSEILLDHKVVKFLDEMKNLHLEGIFIKLLAFFHLSTNACG